MEHIKLYNWDGEWSVVGDQSRSGVIAVQFWGKRLPGDDDEPWQDDDQNVQPRVLELA